MNRKSAFITMLLIFLTAGISACIFYYLPAMQPAVPTASVLPQQASLAPPEGGLTDETAKKKEAVLPTLPEFPGLSDSDNSSGASDDSPEPRYRYTASHSSQRLFIRDGGSMRANIIGSLQPGESGEVISLGETWVLLRYKDIEGYVFREYLELTEIPQSEDLPES